MTTTTKRTFTAEDRAKALATKAAKAEAGAHLRRDFLDSEEWDQLAKEAGLRLPLWHQRATRGQMGRWLQKTGLTAEHFQAFTGFSKLERFAKANPDWPLRAFVGLLLEEAARIRQGR